MARIPDIALNTSIYLYRSTREALDGEAVGGTGTLIAQEFEFQYPGHKCFYVYAVTNSHVVRNGGLVIRLNTQSGKVDTITTTQEDWYHHPDGDDVAVYPIDLEYGLYNVAFHTRSMMLTPETIAERNIGVGSDTVSIGRFITVEGKQQNTPVARFGNIAMMPNPRERIYNETTQMRQESFLVESHSMGGYSGSVVLVYDKAPGKSDAYILGIVWGHINRYEYVEDSVSKRAVGITADWERVAVPTGMMAVVPAWKIAELLDTEDLVMYRAEEQKRVLEEISKKAGRVSPDSADEEPQITKEEFEAALRKVSRPKEYPPDEGKSGTL